jgi:hypothetical protein
MICDRCPVHIGRGRGAAHPNKPKGTMHQNTHLFISKAVLVSTVIGVLAYHADRTWHTLEPLSKEMISADWRQTINPLLEQRFDTKQPLIFALACEHSA